MSVRRRLRSRRDSAELNITAFMNLMVVLVPFLLITAVFSRITILELNLPSADQAAPPSEKQALNLTVVVRADGLQVFATNKLVQGFPREGETYAVEKLNELLTKIKARAPETFEARVLLEADIKYDVLVNVMDAMRVAHDNGQASELFPAISIGDAPPRSAQ